MITTELDPLSARVSFSTTVSDVGVLVDSQLSMADHVTALSRASFPATPTQARAVIANYGISKDARSRIREQPSGLLQQPALRRQ